MSLWSLLSQWVGRQVRFARFFLTHVSVHLRGAWGGVTEKLLDDPEISPAIQKVRGERVAHRVRADSLREPGVPRCARYRLLHH